ncbi:MAG: MFS transporter [Ahniella sp.]|nr:MFS transporter [Ahniella sp.]
MSATELRASIFSGAFFFLVLFAYYVIRPVREQLGAAAGGSAVLPWIWGMVFLVMLAATPLYGALVAKLSPRRFIPIVYAFFAVGMWVWAGFIPVEAPGRVFATAFYVWVGVFNLYVVTVFWSFMTDIFTSEQSKRLFGPIAIGGTIGALSGPAFAHVMVGRVGVPGLLVASGILLACCIPVVALLVQWSKAHGKREAGHDNPIGGGLLAGARALFRNPFLTRMALLLVLTDMIATVLYSLTSDVARSLYPDAEARTQFFAWIDLRANLAQLIIQALLARFLLMRLGSHGTLVFVALVNAFILAILAWHATAFWLVFAIIASRALGYGVVQPARDSLYTRVDREERYKAKSFIDTVVWRGGDTLASFSLRGVQLLGASLGQIAAIGVGFALLSAWLSRNVHKQKGLNGNES